MPILNISHNISKSNLIKTNTISNKNNVTIKPKLDNIKPTRNLTLKQQQFCIEYIKSNGNATEAVSKSYPNIISYSSKAVVGHDNLNNLNITNRIQEILIESGLTPEFIITKLKGIIDSNNTTEINKSIKTAAEIMGLIGRNNQINTQVNLDLQISNNDKAILDKYIQINKTE